MPDPSCVCDLYHSSWQYRLLNPLSEAKDQTWVLMDASQILFCGATMGIPLIAVLICVSLMTNEVKFLFMSLSAVWLGSLLLSSAYSTLLGKQFKA